MAYMKIPHIFFDLDEIKLIEKMNLNDELIVFLLKLILRSKKNTSGIYEYSIGSVEMDDKILSIIFRHDKEFIEYAFRMFDRLKIIEREPNKISINPFWKNSRDRNSPRYKKWRKDVFTRDGFKCTKCGSTQNIQAHHVIPWAETAAQKELRFDIKNGITLCRMCHLLAHGGSWR